MTLAYIMYARTVYLGAIIKGNASKQDTKSDHDKHSFLAPCATFLLDICHASLV